MPRRALLLLLLAAALLPCGCGDGPAAVAVPPHPAHLVGRYAARAAGFRDEVVAAMRYGIRDGLEGEDQAAAARLRRHLDAASAAWCRALENVLELRANGSLVWLLKEPLTADPARGIRLVDLPPPSVPAAYAGTWRQTAPGEITVEFTARNGRPLRWPETGRCKVRPDGGLDASWSRDLEMSIEEAPLLREAP